MPQGRLVKWTARSGPMCEVVYDSPEAAPMDVLVQAIKKTSADRLSILASVKRAGRQSWWMLTQWALAKAGLLAAEPVAIPPSPTQDQISSVMRELGRRGGLKGGPRRAAVLSPGRRSEIAAHAARKRWGKE